MSGTNPDAARRRLAEVVDKAPRSRPRSLALALTGRGSLPCSLVQEQIPACVDSELSGGAVAKPLWEHLLTCPSCGELYAEVLEAAWLVQRGDIGPDPDAPPPDLSFLAGPR